MKKRSLTKAFATAGIGTTLAVVAAVPASAISRPDCGDRAEFQAWGTTYATPQTVSIEHID